MKYTEKEQYAMKLLDRTDLAHIRKDEVVTIVSLLGGLRPEVAKEIIAQFPELASVIPSAASEYKAALDSIIASDDSSINHFYDSADKTIDNAHDRNRSFYELANSVRDDYSKALDNPNLTEEERKEILQQELELVKMADARDKEDRAQDREVLNEINQKDSEKRQFNWGLVKNAGIVLGTFVGLGLVAFGGHIEIPLPNVNSADFIDSIRKN